MADKNVTYTTPVAGDVQAVTIIYEDGVPKSVEVSLKIQSTDATTRHPSNCNCLPADFTAGVQTALSDLATEGAAVSGTKLGF